MNYSYEENRRRPSDDEEEHRQLLGPEHVDIQQQFDIERQIQEQIRNRRNDDVRSRNSSRSSGSSGRLSVMQANEMQFMEMRQTFTREQVNKACCDFVIDLLFLTFIVLLLQFSLSDVRNNSLAKFKAAKEQETPAKCGIPVLMWLEVFFLLFGVRSFFQLFKICIIHHCYAYRHQYQMAQLVLVDGMIVAWLCYGNQLYYSKENDCGTNERMQFLNEFMGCILFIGYLMMGLYLIIVCTVPCLYLYVRNAQEAWNLRQLEQRGNRLSESQIPSVLASLSRVPFDQEEFRHESTCTICLNEYQSEDMITQLGCDARHYYHSHCLEDWIKSGQNQCPLCRKPIQTFEVPVDDRSALDFDVAD